MGNTDFFDVLNKRRSIRRYKDMPIEQEKIEKLKVAINSSPSAGNLQAYEVVIVQNKETKKRLVEEGLLQSFVEDAPIIFIFFQNPERSMQYGSRGSELYSLQDATIAASYLQLAVTALGLGSVWIGAFNDDGVRHALNAPSNFRPVAIIPVGYPAEEPRKTRRRSDDDLFHEERLS